MLKLAPDVERDQAAADRDLFEVIARLLLAFNGPNFQEEKARAELAPVLERIRTDEREACVATLEGLDRTGKEWVRDSLWASIFRSGIDAIRARSGVGRCECIDSSRPDLVVSHCPQHADERVALVGRFDPRRDLPEPHPVAYRYRYVYPKGPGPWKVRQAHIASSPGSAAMAPVEVQPLYTAPPPLEARLADVSDRLVRYLDRRRAAGKGPGGG